MKPIQLNTEEIMSLLSTSPELKALVEAEKRKDAAAEKRARIECLARIKASESAQVEKQKALDAAVAALEAGRAKVLELQSITGRAAAAFTEEQRTYMIAARELNEVHGEGAVSATLFRCDRLIRQTNDEIKRLEEQKSPHVMVDGRITFRPVSPDIATRQKLLVQRVEAYQKLYEKAKEFVLAPMAPSEIHELCESICDAIGQPIQLLEVVDSTSPDTH